MPKILGVHGIWNEYAGYETLKSEWLPRLKDGLRLAGHPMIGDADFECVFFGDLFRPSGAKSVTPRAVLPSDVTAAELDVLEEWCAEARRQGAEIPAPGAIETKGRAPRGAQWMLRQLSKSNFFMALGGERFVLWLLAQVHGYLHDPVVRRAALGRLEEAVGADTVVIVGHSLGTIVAYEALCAHPEWTIRTFVSLGSPLGIRNLVFDRLTPPAESGRGVWPNVQHWVNIADTGDIVALQKDLARCFGPRVSDVSVHNGWESHSVLRYLTAKQTGEAIATGLQ